MVNSLSLMAAPGDLLRQLVNERARVKRRLDKAQAEVAGIDALKDVLRPYLQPGDYEHIHQRLQGEVERWDQREKDLGKRVRAETHRQKLSGEYRYWAAW